MKKILLFLLIVFTVATTVAWIRYGGGEEYVDLTTTPALPPSVLEQVLSYAEPIGNVAVSRSGRVFFTVHPEARPQGNRLLEYLDGASEPYPNVESQLQLFDTVLGLAVDDLDRLWVLDHGNHGLRQPRLIAFDLETAEIIRDQPLAADIAPLGSLLQDLAVSPDGNTIVIADASYWRKQPALIVYDVQTGDARRILSGDKSVAAENFRIENSQRRMSFLGGIFSLRGGVNAVAYHGDWVYFGALSGSGLFRLKASDLENGNLPDTQLRSRVERVASKPMSDGMAIDAVGNIYLTDIEHNSVAYIDGKRPRTLLRSDSIRWPESLTMTADGWLYIADSALQDVVLMPESHIKAQSPYAIYRFRPESLQPDSP